MRTILTGFLILATFCGTTSACSCSNLSDNAKYCNADFVMKVRVKDNLYIPKGRQAKSLDAYYRIKIKGTPLIFPNVDSVDRLDRLYTGRNSGLCGVTLQEGQKYFITGTVDENGRMIINSCNSMIVSTRVRKTNKWWKKHEPDCTVNKSTSSSVMP